MVRVFLAAAFTTVTLLHAGAGVPDGTWKWSSTMGDRTINSTLRLDSDGDKVSGTYRDENIEKDVVDGSVQGDELNFKINVDFNGQPVSIQFRGSVADNEINGIVQFHVDGQQQGEDFPWNPKRHVGSEEVVGEWNFRYTAPDGVEYTPALTVTDDDPLTAKIGIGGETVDVESISLEDHTLKFSYTVPYQGSDLDITCTCHPKGHKLTGMLAYDLDGQTGEFEIGATRKHLSAAQKKLLGSWKFDVTGDDGIERHPILKLSEKAGELQVSLADGDETFDLRDIRHDDGEIRFAFTRDHDGVGVDIEWSCKPDGDGMTGSLEYDAQGNTGEIEFTGKRVE